MSSCSACCYQEVSVRHLGRCVRRPELYYLDDETHFSSCFTRIDRSSEPPLFPCPKKFTFWDTTLLPRGTFWVRVRAGPLADAPRPFSSCSPAAPRRKMRDR